MRALLIASLLLLPGLAAASPLGFAVRLEKVWREETPCATFSKHGKALTPEQEWRDDVLASIAADYEFGGSGLYGILRYGHRFDAEQNEGAAGLEYRFTLGGCMESAKPPPTPKRRITKAKKKPCP